MSATPDVIMHELGETLPLQMATEDRIKEAFISAGYGPKKVEKWWNYYISTGYIQPVSKSGLRIKDDHGQQLYMSRFWLDPVIA